MRYLTEISIQIKEGKNKMKYLNKLLVENVMLFHKIPGFYL